MSTTNLLLGSIWMTYKLKIAKIILIGNPRWHLGISSGEQRLALSAFSYYMAVHSSNNLSYI